MANTPRKKPRVGNFNAGLLIGFAVLCDLTQFVLSFLHVIPYVGNAIAFVLVLYVTIVAYLVLGIWFAICGVNYFTGNKAALKVLTLLASIGIELIPIVDSLPAITAGVITMVIVSRIEDAAGVKAKKMNEGHVAGAQGAIGDSLAEVASAMKGPQNILRGAHAVARTAGRALGRDGVPNESQISPTETDNEKTARQARASKHPETESALKEFQGFSNDAKQFNIDRIDPSFYGLKTEEQRRKYEVWRRAKSMAATSGARQEIGQNVDNIRQKPPEADS